MNILDDKQLRFHGIGQNLLKYISILENGIVTKNDSTGIEGYTKNYDGYNKDSIVSTAMSPSINNTYTYGAFGTYIVGGIGFVLKDSIGIRSRESQYDSGFIDEEFHQGSIPKQNMIGITVDKSILKSKISDLRILNNMGTGYIDSTCYSILDYLSQNGLEGLDSSVIDDLIAKKQEAEQNYLACYDQRDSIIGEMDSEMGKFLEQYFTQTLRKDSITLKDVIDFYNKDKLPLYDEKGHLINERDMFAYNLQVSNSVDNSIDNSIDNRIHNSPVKENESRNNNDKAIE